MFCVGINNIYYGIGYFLLLWKALWTPVVEMSDLSKPTNQRRFHYGAGQERLFLLIHGGFWSTVRVIL